MKTEAPPDLKATVKPRAMAVARETVGAYKRFEYTTAHHTLYNYATVTTSAVCPTLDARCVLWVEEGWGGNQAQ